LTLFWMAITSYVTLACFEMKAVFMPSGVIG
jgi:hypothetical protein